MTPDDFLKDLLKSQDLTPQQESDLQKHKKEVTDFLLGAFDTTPEIKYAGSREKGTMIRDRYDLDIVCYFPHTDQRSLKEIREDLSRRLSEKYFMEDKASSERILDLKGATAPGDFHIDVVPGRFIEGSKDVFLHVASGEKERMQTNLRTHIDHIVNSGCVPMIRLAKLWAHRNNIQIKTFVLELFVVEVLSGSRNKGNLKAGFLEVLEAFRDSFESTQLVDPANSNNIVSQLVPREDKAAVAAAAESTFDSIESGGTSDWQDAFREDATTKAVGASAAASAVAYASGSSFTPTRPWRGDHDQRS